MSEGVPAGERKDEPDLTDDLTSMSVTEAELAELIKGKFRAATDDAKKLRPTDLVRKGKRGNGKKPEDPRNSGEGAACRGRRRTNLDALLHIRLSDPLPGNPERSVAHVVCDTILSMALNRSLNPELRFKYLRFLWERVCGLPKQYLEAEINGLGLRLEQYEVKN